MLPCAGLALLEMETPPSLLLLSSQQLARLGRAPRRPAAAGLTMGGQDGPHPAHTWSARAAGCSGFQAILSCSGPTSKVTLLSPREK